MKKNGLGVLVGAVALVLCGAAHAKTNDCSCHSVRKIVHHPAAKRAPAAGKYSRTQYSRSYSTGYEYYDYYEAREAKEGPDTSPEYFQRQDDYRQDASGERDRSYDNGYYGNAYREASGPPTQLHSRDFNGGVGYSQYGGMSAYQGGYQSGYGRPDPRNGNFDMNGGAMSNAAAARFSVWHGYNSHNGLGNGY